MHKWIITISFVLCLLGCKSNTDESVDDESYKTTCASTIYDEIKIQDQILLSYPELDTFYFKPDLELFDSIKIAVNCLNIYADNCWENYSGDSILLTNRSLDPNGWADGPFTVYIPENVYEFAKNVDPKAKRNNLKKYNVIRFQLYKDTSKYEQVFHIGVGIKKPSNHIVMVDYENLLDMVGPNGNYAPGLGFNGYCDELKQEVKAPANYSVQTSKVPEYRCAGMTRCFTEKPVLFSVYNKNSELEIQQHVGCSLSCNASANYPAKGLQVVARSDYGKSKWKANLFNETEKYKNVRLRLGGTGQLSFPCQHVMDAIGHDLYAERGLKNQFMSLYMNGSQWGVGYMQEKLDEFYVEKYYGSDQDFVDVVEIVGQNDKGLVCHDKENAKKLDEEGLLESLGYHEYLSFSKDYCWLAAVKDGNGKAFSKFYEEAITGDFSHLNQESLLDYLIHIDFLTVQDMGRNNTMFFCTDRRNPMWYVQGVDFDHSFGNDPFFNHWEIILDAKDQDPFRSIVRKYLENPEHIVALINRYQDLLNTRYHLNTMIPKVETRLEEFSLEAEAHEYAWQPNALEADKWLSRCYTKPFFQDWLLKRSYAVRLNLANTFMRKIGYNVSDQKEIIITFPKEMDLEEEFKIKINTIDIKENFKGKYFPWPNIELEIQNLPDGYEFLGWEGLEAEANLKTTLSLSKDLSIKPIIKKKLVE